MQTLLCKLKPLNPIPTDVQENYSFLEGIKTVVFDIYGTLIISASGDIGCAEFKGDVAWKALEKEGFKCVKGCDIANVGNEALKAFKASVVAQHTHEKKLGNAYPEVVITEIWQEVVLSLIEQNMLIAPNTEVDYSDIAFLFECLTNPVYPMPNMQETLNVIKNKMPMGIVSNAQFFTPILMNYFLKTKDYLISKDIDGFESQLSSYSYLNRIAKPGTEIYKKIMPGLKNMGIKNNEVLFVGNDMLNDITPANELGFKTVLFAGDKRSLRLRQDDDRVKNTVADRTVTDLKQILNIIGAN